MTSTTIPEEAVKAMPERIYASTPSSSSGCVVSFDVPSLAYDVEYVRADLALPHLPGVGVKEGREYVYTDYELPCDVRTPDGVTLRGMHLSSLMSSFELCKNWPPQDRILSAREPSAARELALEEAAQALEAWGDIYGDNAAKCVRALSSQPVADGWFPIETAPKDGIVLAWCEDAPPQSFKVQAARVRNGKFLTSWNPTHWRPLPSAPSQEVAG